MKLSFKNYRNERLLFFRRVSVKIFNGVNFFKIAINSSTNALILQPYYNHEATALWRYRSFIIIIIIMQHKADYGQQRARRLSAYNVVESVATTTTSSCSCKQSVSLKLFKLVIPEHVGIDVGISCVRALRYSRFRFTAAALHFWCRSTCRKSASTRVN